MDPGLLLRGRQLTLRPFRAEDVTDQYLGWLNDPEVVRFSNQRFRRHTRESSLAYLASFTGTDNLFLSARRSDTDEAVGTLTAYIARPHGTADVGILVGERSAWGRGIGQDAWDTLTHWLLTEGGIRKLTAGAVACNEAMVRIMESSGMHREAVRRAQEIVEGQPQDVVYYARFATR
jgi:ribosomal-protein-alanine N-acetyltransferase